MKSYSLFNKFDFKGYDIPDELKPVANKILSLAQNYESYTLNDDEKALVLTHYTHCSAEYDHFFENKDSELEIFNIKTGQFEKIKWKERVSKDTPNTDFIIVNEPRFNRHGDWEREIIPNAT